MHPACTHTQQPALTALLPLLLVPLPLPQATLAGLWLLPAIVSEQMRFWSFLCVWTCYSAVTGYLLYTCLAKKADASTPRKVYTWFLAVYKVSLAVGVAGYVLLILEMFGAGMLMALIMPKGSSLVLLWYGLYFGILGRDCAEVASDSMVGGAPLWGQLWWPCGNGGAIRVPLGGVRRPQLRCCKGAGVHTVCLPHGPPMSSGKLSCFLCD